MGIFNFSGDSVLKHGEVEKFEIALRFTKLRRLGALAHE